MSSFPYDNYYFALSGTLGIIKKYLTTVSTTIVNNYLKDQEEVIEPILQNACGIETTNEDPEGEEEKYELYKALCNFIEDTTNMTYTDVETKYGRKKDKNDIAIDTEYNSEEFPIDHYSLSEDGIGNIARIHGYLRDGVFVVRRIDWGHHFHEKNKIDN